jgi:hypothetical protein
MSFAADKSANVSGDVATLARHIRSRVLNCSAGGCLLETTAPVAVGSTGKLRVTLDGRDFDDTIQIVRCEHIQGTASVYHVATMFLSTAPPYVGSMRYAMRRGLTHLVAWLDTRDR